MLLDKNNIHSLLYRNNRTLSPTMNKYKYKNISKVRLNYFVICFIFYPISTWFFCIFPYAVILHNFLI